GLTLEAIAEAVPHFNSLSQGKQLLVLENLQQLTLGRIQEEAQDKYRAGVQESKWRGRLWKGITKHFQVRKLEKATAQELQEGGIEAHKTMLWELTRLTQSMPEVEVQNDGTLAIGYAREFESATPEQQEIVSAFNQVANKFARMPEEWSFSTASKKEQQQYMAAKQTYDEAKNKLLTARYEQILVGGDERAAEALSMDYVNEAEFAVRMNQFLNTNPDVEKQLQSIKNEKALTKAIKDIFVERTGLLVGGAVVRSFTISTLGWVAAPIVGAGIGAWRGKARAEETLVEREKAARKGVEDTSEEARQFINAENSGYTLTNQINSLMDEIDKNGEKISRKLASLEAVVKFTRDKIDAGHVNYGTQEDRLRNRYNLLREVAYAQAVVCAYSGDSEVASKIMRRMNSTLTSREQKITKAQSAYMKKQMLKGAAYGAGFALAGAGIRHVAGQAAEATGLDEKFGRAMSSVWGSDEATNTEAPAVGSAQGEKANTPPPGPLAGEGRAQESPDFVQGKVQEKITGTPDAISLNNTEAAVENESVQEAPAEPEAVETAEITGQQRIEKTATHFGFKPADGQEGALVLNMAEAAEKDPNLGKLEQVLDRLVAAQYVKEFGDKLDPDEAAKILNMAANLRVAFERGDASFMDKWASEGGDKLSQLFNESLEYDAESKTLTIKNQVTFEQLVDGLKEHADELGSAGKLDGAVGELPKIKQDTWRDIVNAAQDKDIEVEDYSKNERVKAAYLANQAKDAPLAAD
ncbi:MAG: hypothetical protein U1C18_01480, partial [Patescibacteria group bacterium]|nr:hypothetical protein [Patescibacteria group bacterium]